MLPRRMSVSLVYQLNNIVIIKDYMDIFHVFLDGCNIKNGKAGVQMTMSREGRPSGEAYVEMESEDDVERACKKDRDHMGHRYIEGEMKC